MPWSTQIVHLSPMVPTKTATMATTETATTKLETTATATSERPLPTANT